MTKNSLIHYTRDANLEKILREGQLLPGPTPFGVYPIPREFLQAHRSVCLTDLPFEQSKRIAKRKSSWGIAFKREALEKAGARKVRYLKGSEIDEQKALQYSASGSPDHPLWKDSPFLAPVLPVYSYEWEQEWRHVGPFEFEWEDVAYLINPVGEEIQLIPETELGEFYFDKHDTNTLCWDDGASEPFNRVMHHVAETYAAGYIDPEAVLFRDKEDETGYNWGVFTKHDAFDILTDSLPPLPQNVIEQILDEMNMRAQYWVSEEEFYAED